MSAPTDDLNIASNTAMMTPQALKRELPLQGTALETVRSARKTLFSILDRQDPRLFVVVGPCSIHDVDAAMDYAKRLKALASKVADTLFIIMRVYFEKPRTSIGWKGLINDPRLDDSFKIEEGLRLGRKLLLDITALGLPASTEALDPISPQYMQDLIAWSAIGARTTESQTHREMSSGLSSPVGFKNGTDGGLMVAINAMQSVSSPHRFLGINSEGQVSVVTTRGNPYAHVVLRGGSNGPNFDSVHVAQCEAALQQGGVSTNIMVDCSHANSSKDPELQPLVLKDITHQIMEGNHSIIGVMLESHIHAGNQSIPQDLSQLRYGVSVTDACMGWETTETALLEMTDKLREILPVRSQHTQALLA
ncbi:MAG: 3-deoxy-7-phosphoheptulonate synthase [Gammaproteobacteria bacterium]|nr:3-deoxy-7-phosphoheptulonate synthase [Gammaproteobacteria bacterium]